MMAIAGEANQIFRPVTMFEQIFRWMRKDRTSRLIIFDGEKLDMQAVWRVRDEFFPPR